MKKNKFSKNWIIKQKRDIYVKKSKLEGYRSRAVYKLQEINEKQYSNNETVINDENTGKVFVYNHKTEKNKPMFLEEQIRESIPVDGEKNETV